MQLLTHIFTSLTAATLLLLLATESHSCLVSHPFDVFSPAETCYESSLLLNNNDDDDDDDDDTAYPMLSNYLRQTTRSLRVAPILRSSSASAFVSSSSSSKTTTSSMSSSTPEASNKSQNEAITNPQTNDNTAPQLALPSTSSDDVSHSHKLDVSGGQGAGSGSGSTVSLDHLGPIVVNQDGTMSRISNWEKMTEIERQNTMRIIGKRNKQRLEALKAAGA